MHFGLSRRVPDAPMEAHCHIMAREATSYWQAYCSLSLYNCLEGLLRFEEGVRRESIVSLIVEQGQEELLCVLWLFGVGQPLGHQSSLCGLALIDILP